MFQSNIQIMIGLSAIAMMKVWLGQSARRDIANDDYIRKSAGILSPVTTIVCPSRSMMSGVFRKFPEACLLYYRYQQAGYHQYTVSTEDCLQVSHDYE
jgi:hypothetical protein